MAGTRLSASSVNALISPDPSGRNKAYFDSQLRGFCVWVSGKTDRKTYYVQKRIVVDLDSDGKKVWSDRKFRIGHCNDIDFKKAKAEATRILAEIANGKDPAADKKQKLKDVAKQAELANRNITLRKALDTYIADIKTLRPKTVLEYRKFVENYLRDWLDVELRDLTAIMVRERHTKIAQDIQKRAKKRNANGQSTANAVMRTFRLLYNYAKDELDDSLPENPVRGLKRSWYKDKRRTSYITPSQLPAFVRGCAGLDNRRQRDFLLLLLFTGLRKSEAASLPWDNVDFAERTIRISEESAKSGQELVQPMSDLIYEILKDRYDNDREEGNGFVFPAVSRSGHMSEPKFALDKVCQSAEIELSLHDLRRTFITLADAADIKDSTIKALVNHALNQDVTEGYKVRSVERLREAMQKITDRFKELSGLSGWTEDGPIFV